MRRPLFVLLIGLVLGELCGYLLYLTGVMIPASLFTAAFCLYRTAGGGKPYFISGEKTKYGWSRTRMWLWTWLFLGIMLLGNLTWCLEERKVREAETFAENAEEKECLVRGRIIRRKDTEKTVTYVIGNPVFILDQGRKAMKGRCILKGKVKGQDPDKLPVPGQTGVFPAVLSFPEREKNPGGFNERNYDLANGIYLTGKITGGVQVEKKALTIPGLAYRIKRRMEEGFLKHLSSEDTAMLCAMAFGDKSGLSQEQRKLYEENGMMHLMAVSGLHISGLGGRVYRRLRKAGFSYPSACSGGAFLLLFYGCMAGWGTSVVRAVIMYMVFLTAEYLGYAYDIISAMSLSGMLMLVECPYRLLDSGFQISFAAVTALGLILPFLSDEGAADKTEDSFRPDPGSGSPCSFADPDRRKRMAEKGREGILSGFVVFMATGPLIMRTYYECTPYSILLNPLVLPFMGPLLLSTLLSGLLGLAGPGQIIGAVSLPAVCILRGYSFLFTRVRKLPASLIITGCPSLGRIILIYGAEAMFLLILFRNRRQGKKAGFSSMAFLPLLFILMVCPFPETDGKDLRITMLDVGQGDCILLRLPGRKNILIDGGSSSQDNVYGQVIRPALWYYGLSKLDYVVITHMDDDHISGIREMLQSGYPVKHLVTGTSYRITVPSAIGKIDYEELATASAEGTEEDAEQDISGIDEAEYEICRLCRENRTSWHVMERGDQLMVGEIILSCLHPRKNTLYPDRNDKSLTFLLSWKDFRALFPGDLGLDQEENVLEGLDETITLLKAGHHGSKYSTGDELLDRLKPDYAMISAGKGNLYGHPHHQLLERLEEHGVNIFLTKDHGAICGETDGKLFRADYWVKRR